MQDPAVEVPEPHPWALSAFWFSLHMQNAALLTLVVPRAIARLEVAGRTAQLARVGALAALLSMVVPPVVGAFSDQVRRRAVGRRPFVLAGTGVNVIGLSWMMGAASLPALTVALGLAILGQTAALAAYEAMLPEAVAPERWGQAAAHRGVASLAGSIAGLLAAGVAPLGVACGAMIATAGGGALLTVAAVREPAVPPALRRPVPRVRAWSRFRWVFAARFFVLFGQTLLMTFALYFFSDVLHVRSASAGTALLAALALVGAAVSAYAVGRWSDARDRTHLVAVAGLPMAVAVAGFGLDPSPGPVLALALLWGVGYGAFISVDWALALDSVPDLGHVARDLGVWGIASNLPAVLAPIAGGIILARVAPAVAGYRVLFLVAAASFVLGSLLVEASRGLGPALRLTLAFLVAGLLWAYVALAYRVRWEGTLPRARRGLLVLGNHLHDLEGMVIPVRLFLSAPLGAPLAIAGSARLLEPGFLASRAPRWLGAWLGGLRLATLLRAFGVLPIENMPLSRPLASWAFEVYETVGDRPATEVFRPEALARLRPPPPRSLRDLWSRGRWPQDGPFVGVTALRPPYRQLIRSHMRRRIEGQLADLAAALDAGATLYLTPEGRLSPDGRLGRFRAAFGVVRPHASGLWLAATSFDPWAARRVSMHTRLVPPALPEDPVTSLLAARPVTLSQVLAARLLAAAQGASTAELVAAVRAFPAEAPASAWALPADPGRAVPAALARMLRRGVVRRQGDRWLPGPRRHDPRFGHVPDILAAQARQLEETLAALAKLRDGGDAAAPCPGAAGSGPPRRAGRAAVPRRRRWRAEGCPGRGGGEGVLGAGIFAPG